MKKLSFILTIATSLMLKTLPSLAMDLNIKTLDETGNTSTSSSNKPVKSYTPPVDLGTYPSKISFILGYSRVTLKNAEPTNLSVPQEQQTFNQQLASAPLNGIKLGLTQFITPNWGYEVAMNYYLSKTYSDNINTVYPDQVATVNATSTMDNKLWTVEALAVGGWHVSQNWLLLAKLGLGYEFLTQTNTMKATLGPFPYSFQGSDSYKAHSLGLAGGLGVRYALTHNFSFEMGVNDLAGKRNLLIYEANLLVKA